VHFSAACLEAWARLDVLLLPDSEPCFIEHLVPISKERRLAHAACDMPLFATHALSRSMVLGSARNGLVLITSRTRRTVCLVRRVLLPWTLSGFHRQPRQERQCSPLMSRPPSSRPGAMGEMPVSLLTVAACRVLSEAGWSLAPGAGVACRGNGLKDKTCSLTGLQDQRG
jgi:hypothetical protein